MSKLFITSTLVFIALMCVAFPIMGQSSGSQYLAHLRKIFAEATSNDFEIVKDIRFQRAVARGGETYWLVHVKPKRTGHYTLKYTFKYDPKIKYPEEGESELFIRVGKKGCSRYNYNNYGLSNVCLGDTVIVPIRLDRMSGHEFSLKSVHSDDIGAENQNSARPENYIDSENVVNQLAGQVRYLGMRRYEMPHRNYGAATITFTAFFQAVAPGRFNLSLAAGEIPTNAALTKGEAPSGLPIIIVSPGTPITALAYHENCISYSDSKRFSAHWGSDFITRVLILQPGDVFSVEYSRGVRREGRGGIITTPTLFKDSDPKISIQKLPFGVDKDWSYNEWLTGYLPTEF